jgi:hypothetical protein
MKVKMQVGGSWSTRFFFCHSMLVLKWLFRYMFQEDYEVIKRKTIET